MRNASRATTGWRHALSLAALSALAVGLTTASGTAQGEVITPDVYGGEKPAIVIDSGFHADIPQAPRGLYESPPAHGWPAIPVGPPTPQNDDPPGRDIGPSQPQPETGQFQYFQNRVLGVNSTSVVGEPSAAQMRDTAFQTGNWYAALSKNSGFDWSEISPAAFFNDNTFCCDQRVLYVRSHDLMVWLLQYGTYYRVAVARTRDALRSNSSANWRSYTFDAPDFGGATTDWLDFPDIAVSDNWLHISANIFNSASSFQFAVRWRMELVDLAAGAAATWSYSTSTALGGGFAYRFAEGGDGSQIYYAAIKNTTTLWIWTNTDATGSNSRVERSVNSWTSATANCPGPDGRSWCGRVVGRLRGSFGNSSSVGWIWTSAANGGSRPLPYSRIATFAASNRNKLTDNDQWSSTLTWAYGQGASNSSGHIGLTFAVGGPTSYVRGTCTIVDSYQTSFGGMSTFSMTSGTHGPFQDRWGDYFDVQRHPNNASTFVGTGMAQNGGTANGNNEPRYVWFGRDDYAPTWVNLAVNSTGVSAVSITLDIKDRLGSQNGATNFNRSFAPRQGYTLTAPATKTSGSTVYAFERWAHATVPTGTPVAQALGVRDLAISDIGNADDIAEARYLIRRTLTVTSTNPGTGVAITVSAADINGNQNGSTSFTRYYRNGESVSLTAPTSVGFNPFKRWVLNSVAQALGNRTLAMSMTTTRDARAEYYLNVAGAARTIGAGCRGTNGLVPVQSITWPGGQQGPQLGTPTTYRLSSARANTAIVLHFGVDTRIWNGFPLPLNLSIIGMNGCFLYHDLVVSPGFTSNAAGQHAVAVTWPNVASAIGASIYSTYAIVDFGSNPLPIVHSNAMQTLLGGNQ